MKGWEGVIKCMFCKEGDDLKNLGTCALNIQIKLLKLLNKFCLHVNEYFYQYFFLHPGMIVIEFPGFLRDYPEVLISLSNIFPGVELGSLLFSSPSEAYRLFDLSF